MKLRDTLTALLGLMIIISEVPADPRTETCEQQLRFIVFFISVIWILAVKKEVIRRVAFLPVMSVIHLST